MGRDRSKKLRLYKQNYPTLKRQIMSNFTAIPLGFQVLSTQPNLHIRYYRSTSARILIGCFVFPFFVLFILHGVALLRALHHVFNLQFEQALFAIRYDATSGSVFPFIFSFVILGTASWIGIWWLLGRTELRATNDALLVAYNFLGVVVQKQISPRTIRYFNQVNNRSGEGEVWALEAVTNQRRIQQTIEFPSSVSADAVARSTYKTIYLYTNGDCRQSAWLGRVLAEFYGVEFRSGY